MYAHTHRHTQYRGYKFILVAKLRQDGTRPVNSLLFPLPQETVLRRKDTIFQRTDFWVGREMTLFNPKTASQDNFDCFPSLPKAPPVPKSHFSLCEELSHLCSLTCLFLWGCFMGFHSWSWSSRPRECQGSRATSHPPVPGTHLTLCCAKWMWTPGVDSWKHWMLDCLFQGNIL